MELGLELPPVSPPAASYVNAVRTGNLVYLSGAGPTAPGHPTPTGKVGADVTAEEAAPTLARSGSTCSPCFVRSWATSTAHAAS